MNYLLFLRPLRPFIVTASCLFSLPAFAVDVPIADDAMVISTSANAGFNYGAHVNLNVSGVTTSVRWSYLKFNVAAFVPAGTVADDVERAVLRLYPNTVTAAGTISAYSVLASWIEGKGSGVAATGGSISWNTKALSDTVAEGSFTLATADADEFIALDVTSLVKDWITTPSSNFGIVLKPVGTTVNVAFDSKENITNTKQPALNITLAKKRILPRGDVSMGIFAGGTPP